MAKRPAAAAKSKPQPDTLARREEAFRLYRDLGVNRTYARLMAILPSRFGEVAERTLNNWARENDWKQRCEEYDRRTQAADYSNLDPKFDQIDYLLKSAHLVLVKALNTSVDIIPTKPGEIKQLIDAGRNAILLCQKLMEMRQGGRDGDGAISKKMMFDELERVEQRVREVLAAESRAWRHARACEAMLREHGFEPPAREAEVITVEAVEVKPNHRVSEERESSIVEPQTLAIAQHDELALPQAVDVEKPVVDVESRSPATIAVEKPKTVADRLAAFFDKQH